MKTPAPSEEKASALEQRNYSTPPCDLFPECLPAMLQPAWPNRHSRAGEALEALQAGPLNQYDYRVAWRLSAYIQTLEDLGWRFVVREVIRPGCRKPIAEYSLDRSDPGTAAALASRQAGRIDPTLAGSTTCAALLLGMVA